MKLFENFDDDFDDDITPGRGFTDRLGITSSDAEYWEFYNRDSLMSSKKQTDLDGAMKDAVSAWNSEGGERITMEMIQDNDGLMDTIRGFFRHAGWISVAVLTAMIMQELS